MSVSATAVLAWTEDLSMEVTEAAAALFGASERWAKSTGSAKYETDYRAWATELMDAAQSAPVTERSLYHGRAILTTLVPGDAYDVPLMATSPDRVIAEGFAMPHGEKTEYGQSVFEFLPGSHAVALNNGEHVLTGHYVVRSVITTDGVTHVVLEPVAVIK